MNTKQLKTKLKTLSDMLKQSKDESIKNSHEDLGEMNYPYCFGYLWACVQEVYEALDKITENLARKEVK